MVELEIRLGKIKAGNVELEQDRITQAKRCKEVQKKISDMEVQGITLRDKQDTVQKEIQKIETERAQKEDLLKLEITQEMLSKERLMNDATCLEIYIQKLEKDINYEDMKIKEVDGKIDQLITVRKSLKERESSGF